MKSVIIFFTKGYEISTKNFEINDNFYEYINIISMSSKMFSILVNKLNKL